MAPVVSSIVAFALYVILSSRVSGDECLGYSERFKTHSTVSSYQSSQECFTEFCCGYCYNRYCCSNPFMRFDKDQQERCLNNVHTLTLPAAIAVVIVFFAFTLIFILISCCVFPSCCLYKRFRQPRPDNTHTTVVTTTPQQYPQQPVTLPGPSQGVPYQSATLQPGFAAQYGYPAQPMSISPYHGQAFAPGPPPLYLEAIGPAYSSQPMPYGQVEFTHGQPAYPLKPLDQQQPDAPPASTAFQPQSAPPP
ncbi:protein shisa-5-like [Pelmatolapia mariae]|uniref:protein shisa-5-like n=1 Tax=Pelmatolapia mariae TaxID=158779 RepID=UPI002FE584C6